MLLLIGISMSCVDTIDLEAEAGLSDSVGINGRLTKDGDTTYVKLVVTNIFDFDLLSRRPITVNKPRLYNSQGEFVLLERTELSEYEAIISPSTGFDIDFGQSYFVEVELTDGRTYRSLPDVLLPVPPIELFSWDTTSIPIINTLGGVSLDKRIVLNVSTSFPEDAVRPNLLWELERTYKITDSSPLEHQCFVREDQVSDRVNYADLRGSTVGSIDIRDQELNKVIIDQRLTEGSLFKLYQYSLSDQAVEYWESVDQLLRKSGTMFDVPGSEIKTNFYNVEDAYDPVYGHFFSTTRDEAFFKIDSTDFPELSKFCIPSDGSNPFESSCPSGCCGCLTSIPGATLTPPARWF